MIQNNEVDHLSLIFFKVKTVPKLRENYEKMLNNYQSEINASYLANLRDMKSISPTVLLSLETYLRITKKKNIISLKVIGLSYLIEALPEYNKVFYVQKKKSLAGLYLDILIVFLSTSFYFIRGYFEHKRIRKYIS